MKILKIYESIIREEEASAKANYCIKAFGHELFADQLGGSEPNTDKENDYVKLIKAFTTINHGVELQKELVTALNHLSDCMSVYPEILVTKGYVYRGTIVPFKFIYDNIQNFNNMGEIPFTYHAKSIIQSWTENEEIAKQYSYGVKNQRIDNAFIEFNNIKPNYLKMSPEQQVKFLNDFLNRFTFLSDNVPVMLRAQANPDEFLFKAKYFKKLSEYSLEDEVLRIDNRPLKCILNTAKIIIFVAREIRKYSQQLEIDESDFE